MNRERVIEHLAFARQQLAKVNAQPDNRSSREASRIYRRMIEHLTSKLSLMQQHQGNCQG